MIDYFINIFETACISLSELIPFVFVIWFIFDMLTSLFFKDR